MNYTLSINLEGFDKAEQILSKLSGGVKDIANSPKISFNKWLDAGSEADGESIGEKVSNGFKKRVKKNLSGNWLGLLGEFGQAVQKASNDAPKEIVNQRKPLTLSSLKSLMNFWDDAVKNAMPALPSITQKVDWKKILTGVGLGFSNPYIGSRLLSDEFGKLSAGKTGGIAGGLFGKGGIAGFSEIFIAFKIFKFAVDNFKRIIDSAVSKAFNLYTQAAQQGLNAQFYAQRSILASVLGVSGNPNQVFMFGKAVEYVSERTAVASSVLAHNARPLAQLSMEAKILEYDFSALVSNLVTQVAPAIDLFIESLDNLVTKLTKHSQELWIGAQIAMGVNPSVAALAMVQSQKASKTFGSKIPALIPTMKQLPASSWEHMGLATMGAGNSVPQLIKKSNEYLKTIAASVTMHGPGSSGQFGLSPTVANP